MEDASRLRQGALFRLVVEEVEAVGEDRQVKGLLEGQLVGGGEEEERPLGADLLACDEERRQVEVEQRRLNQLLGALDAAAELQEPCEAELTKLRALSSDTPGNPRFA